MKTKIGSNMKVRSLRTKLTIMCLIILIVPTFVIGISSYFVSKNEMNESGKVALKNSVQMVIGMISFLNGQVEAGNLTLEEAQEKLRIELLGVKDANNKRPIKIKYTVGKTGYPWAVNQDAVSMMNPSNEGQNLMNAVSEDGVHVGKEFVEVGTNGGDSSLINGLYLVQIKWRRKFLMLKRILIGDGSSVLEHILTNLTAGRPKSFILS